MTAMLATRKQLTHEAGRTKLPLSSFLAICLFVTHIVILAADARGMEQDAIQLTRELQERIATVYDRTRSAVVRVDGQQGDVAGGGTGVIVSNDGFVLIPASLTRMELTFRLDDGRNVPGKALGWSDEYGIGMARLEGGGPWPHVELTESRRSLLGEAVVTLTFPTDTSTTIVPHPLAMISWIDRAAPGRWFMTPGSGSPLRWHRTAVAFDLDGRLVGMTQPWDVAAQIFTDADLIQTVFDGLAAGKNVDRQQLASIKDEELIWQSSVQASANTVQSQEDRLLTSPKQFPHFAMIFHRQVQVGAGGDEAGMTCRSFHFGQRSATRWCMANEGVPAVVNGQ